MSAKKKLTETAERKEAAVLGHAAELPEGAAKAEETAGLVKLPAKAAARPDPVAQPEKKTGTAKASRSKPAADPVAETPCRVCFIGSECYPFVKTGGLGDVMYALPRALKRLNCDVRVILPHYACIPETLRAQMKFAGEFMMDLCADGREFYVGLLETEMDGVTYYFIDNQEFFDWGTPYTDLVKDIPKYIYFDKAALAVLNYLEWIPDVIHCHDWQTGLVPPYLRTKFSTSPVGSAKSVITIHNLRFQGVYNIPTIQYWSGLPGYAFDHTTLKQGYEDASMFKGGLAYANSITTVSETYAEEIQTPFYGDGLDAHLRHHAGKLRGIVNGIDVELWNPRTDHNLKTNYSVRTVLKRKVENKRALQKRLGLELDDGKFVIGLVSRLTDQKGLDLVNAILPELLDGDTQLVFLGTGEQRYEDAFCAFAAAHPESVSATIAYADDLSHQIYAGADAFLVPSLFEPCGLTQLIAMHYGTVPIVRETGGLKDTVLPYNAFTNEGNGFTFDRYEAELLLDAVVRARSLYGKERDRWNEMVVRDMKKDVSWDRSARQYKELYLQLM